MACTQTDIAKRIGVHVSSVNKILNRVRGPVFHKDTIDKVFLAAEVMGYDVKSPRAGLCKGALREIILSGHLNGVSEKKLQHYKRLAGL